MTQNIIQKKYGFMKFRSLTYKNKTHIQYRIIKCSKNLMSVASSFEKCLINDIKKGEPDSYLFFMTSLVNEISYSNIINTGSPSFKTRTHIYSNKKLISSWDISSYNLYNHVLNLCPRILELSRYTTSISNMDKISLVKEYKKVFGVYPSYYVFESLRSKRDLMENKKQNVLDLPVISV